MAGTNRRIDAARQAEEDYLKTAMLLQIQKGHTYVSDLSEALDMKLATTYSAVNRLAEKGYIQPLERRGGRKSNKQSLVFTPEGEEIAKRILARHQMILGWLIRLGVPLEEAEEEACHMEHGLTDRTVALLQEHVEMAGRMLGGQDDAPDMIRKMAQHMKENQQAIGMTTSQKLISTVERLGGLEGLERKGALISRGGGEESLGEILNLVESLGGYQTLLEQREQWLAQKRLLDLRGGVAAVTQALEAIDELGGVQAVGQVRLAANLLGGVEEMTAFVRRAKTLADKVGGKGPLLELLEREYRLWSHVLLGEDECPEKHPLKKDFFF